MFKLSTSKSQAGFTIIEVLVALLVLSLGVIMTITLFIANANSAASVRDSFVASGLVQEGIEVGRNLRDSDWHAGRPFGSFGNPGEVVTDGIYEVQYNSQQLRVDTNSYLKRDLSSGLFSYDSGNATSFKRQISLSTISAVERRLVVTVTWTDKSNNSKTLAAEDHLFNWNQ